MRIVGQHAQPKAGRSAARGGAQREQGPGAKQATRIDQGIDVHVPCYRSRVRVGLPLMRAIVSPLVDLCLLRGSPRELPYSVPLLLALMLASVVLASLAAAWLGADETVAGRALAWMLAKLGIVWLLLKLRGLPSRFVQTASAMLGTSLILSLLLLPLSNALYQASQQPETAASPLLALVWIFLFAWSFIVDGHVLRHALAIPLSAGVLISLALFTLRSLVEAALRSPPPL